MIAKTLILLTFILTFLSCYRTEEQSKLPWGEYGKLKVEENSKIIQHEDGTPFLWLGCTSWGILEWMSREEIEFYLDDRQSKGMNVVQLCLFWGKREDNPAKFTANAPNFYGHSAFLEKNGIPNPLQPDVREGGSPGKPNDYWDHVDFCLNAIKKRGMYAALLPFWGRRYVNATHPNQSLSVFTLDNIFQYGQYLGKRYRNEPHIIWINGGDVKADDNGDYLSHYRMLAEGLVNGITNGSIKWNQDKKEWSQLLMTYHPDGAPLINSSTWFHADALLDFNMIETFTSRDKVAESIRIDLAKMPLKPTVLGEGQYEGIGKKDTVKAIHIRRQAYQAFFSGAAGYTYGGFFDEHGNGPLFSGSNNWKPLLAFEGASQIRFLKNLLIEKKWWKWQLIPKFIVENRGEGELEKLAVRTKETILIYFPENSSCKLANNETLENLHWYNTTTGETISGNINALNVYTPPSNWQDGVLILN